MIKGPCKCLATQAFSMRHGHSNWSRRVTYDVSFIDNVIKLPLGNVIHASYIRSAHPENSRWIDNALDHLSGTAG